MIPDNIAPSFVELGAMACAAYNAQTRAFTGCTDYLVRCTTDTTAGKQLFARSGNTFICSFALPSGLLAVFNYDIKSTVSILPGGNGIETWACRGDGNQCNDPSCWRQFGTIMVNNASVDLTDAINNNLYGCNFLAAY
jgi:hypothetical protein